jgi:hypothetical protein
MRDVASGDRQVLLDAGIPAYVKWNAIAYWGVSLMVPEPDVERALALLSSTSAAADASSHDDPALTCPYCGSQEVQPRPPYLLIPLGFAFALAVVLAIRGSLTLAFATLFTGFAVAAIAHRALGRWRCRSCGRVYSN